jgi:DNA (cytosine-5)-methyltransferase 1
MSRGRSLTFYEFFAGGGMARAGLGEAWRCLFANDFDAGKARAYRDNWGEEDLALGDVWDLSPEDLPGRADLAWASSPCQDLSLAGSRAGLVGGRSSAFWGFWRLMQALMAEGRAPRVIVLENVAGLLSSNAGADFTAVCQAFGEAGYVFGAVEIDASAFLPHSRPRVFVIAARQGEARETPAFSGPPGAFHGRAVVAAHGRLPAPLAARWRWWRLPAPARSNTRLIDLLEPDGAVRWRSPRQTEILLGQLSPLHQERLSLAMASRDRLVAAVYRRIRVEQGVKVQRAELRLDGRAGCLRTPAGGSSRQLLLVAENSQIRSRHLTAREGARLMGLPDAYRLPSSQTAALHLLGDGVAVPVVRFLAETLIEPLLNPPAAVAAAE